MKKIAIIGAGNVGAHTASSIIQRDISAEIHLIDQHQDFEKAQVLDLKDSLLFHPKGKIFEANYGDKVLSDCDIIVITAGAKQETGESRCKLLGRNIQILQKIKKDIGEIKPSCIVILITNPVDILTKAASEIFGLPWGQVFGTGTLLDSSRLRWRLGEKFKVNVKNTHGMVLGEHGDSEFVAWSTVSREEKLSDQEKEDIELDVRNAAYKIIEGKGSTYFGIGSSCAEFIENIFSDSQAILPVSVPLNGQYGIHGIAVSVPAQIGEKGVIEIVEKDLTEDENKKLKSSAEKLKKLFEACEV